VEGVWCVVGVERSESRRVFVIPVESRDSLTLQRIVQEHVHSVSIIYTDLWKGYNWIEKRPYYTHGTVNHSKTLKTKKLGCTPTSLRETTQG
jgi:transposase-like protein